MHKFHQIHTDTFVPISFENSYLFNHYDKLTNFLTFTVDRNFKNILAKPVQNGFDFDFFSAFNNLKSIDDFEQSQKEQILLLYWSIVETIESTIKKLDSSGNADSKTWAKLLTKVFNDKNNYIFSNGQDICIIWGWEFNNNQIYKPNILAAEDNSKDQSTQELKLPSDEVLQKEEYPVNQPEAPAKIEDEETIEEVPAAQEEDLVEDALPKNNFLDFLKWFASEYWWLLWLLSFLIALVFFFKAITH